MSNKVIAGMATIPSRSPHPTIESLLPQVDHLYIAANHPIPLAERSEKITLWKFCNRRDDTRKLCATEVEQECYYFTVDDDLIYPPDYAEKMVEWVDKYNRQAVVCVHGSYLDSLPIESYYKEKRSLHFRMGSKRPVQVLFPGTGTMVWHASLWRPSIAHMPHKNILDVQCGLAFQTAQIPCISVSRPDNWIRQNTDIPIEGSIWDVRKNDDALETNLINQYESGEAQWAYPSVRLQDAQK